MERQRLNIYVTKEVYDFMKEQADKKGMTMGNLVTIWGDEAMMKEKTKLLPNILKAYEEISTMMNKEKIDELNTLFSKENIEKLK